MGAFDSSILDATHPILLYQSIILLDLMNRLRNTAYTRIPYTVRIFFCGQLSQINHKINPQFTLVFGLNQSNAHK